MSTRRLLLCVLLALSGLALSAAGAETAVPFDPAAGPPIPDYEIPLGGFGTWDDRWTWQVLPEGLLYHAYLASDQESRLGSQFVFEQNKKWLWDVALGGHVGLLRYGTEDVVWPEGWQLDFEGAVFPRLTLDYNRDLVDLSFRAGMPLTFREGPFEAKFGYYHLCSHLGDEYILKYGGDGRLNFVRDELVLGAAIRPTRDWRIYAEAGWAFYCDDGARPWQFQFGIEYSSMEPSQGIGSPFFAVNGHLRQEVDFGGGLTVQTGWQWRNQVGRLARLGLHYFNGKSEQYEFFHEHEQQLGFGVWYDY